MDTLLSALTALTWRDWATLVGVLFGVVTLLAFLEQRRAMRQQSDLLEFVRRHVSRDISEDAIRQLGQQRAAMELQVTEHIPALARAAVLREQAEAHAAAVSYHFVEWKRIQASLGNSPSGGLLDPAIESIIVDRLVPRYERQATLDRLRNRITVFSVALALVSALLPFPLNSAAGVLLAIPLAGTLLQFFRASAEPAEVKATLRPLAIALYVVACVAGVGFSLFLFALGLTARDTLTPSGWGLAWFLLIVGAAGGIMAPWLLKRLDSYLARLGSIPRGSTASERSGGHR